MQWPYGIGLDIGVASVGWAVLALDENAQPCGIIRLGSRIFPAAEHPQSGESLAAPRRTARSLRRRLRRKALRKADIYRLLPQYGLPDRAQMAALFAAGHLEDIYALRARALDGPVPPEAFARILLHLAQRRGFKSNRLSETEAEDGKLLGAMQANAARMAEHGWRTPGEMYARDPLFADHKRNKAENYLATVSREAVLDEACQLFAAQRRFGQAWATPEFEAEYLSILRRQRTFDEGPGGNSPYHGGWEAGSCTLEPGEKRAPKNSASFERFALLQKLNHIRAAEDGMTRPLTDAERAAAVELAYKSENVDYARLRKAFGWPDGTQYTEVRYQPDKTAAECEKKHRLPPLKGYHALRKALGAAALAELTVQQQDDIAQVLFLHRNEDTRRKKLTALGLSAAQAEALLGLRFAKTGHLSVKACRSILPFLEQGMTYDKACAAAGYDFRAHAGGEKQTLLPAAVPEMEDITSPVVRRAVAQTVKVVNAIIREQGHSPVFCHIELARELSRDFAERQKMTREQEDNARQNERLMAELRETYGLLQPTGQDLVKFRLWKEQDGVCAYSLQPLAADRLFEPGYAEVDHIVPYSLSFDDTRANKVLVLASENRQKGNRLPLQYLQGEKRERFIAWTKARVRSSRKRQNLLRQSWGGEEAEGFRQRNLQDTQYMARFLLNFIRDHLAFEPHPAAGKQRVAALAGGITAHLRKRWGLTKVRADGDTHHALDAVVIACATQGMVQQISRWYGRIEGAYRQAADGSGSVHSRTREHFPAPWPHFRDELLTRLSACPQENLLQLNPMFYENFPVDSIRPVFVSRMPRYKVTGEAHEATVRSPKGGEGLVVSKVALTDLTPKKMENYYKPDSDRLLYKALCDRLQAYGGNAKKAFAEPFYKPRADGTPGPLVRKVKIVEPATLTVPVHGGRGVARNQTGGMVRIDVFLVPGDGYYWVPVYVADTRKPQLPDRAVVAFKPYAEWKPMREEDFLFSLYPNDLLMVEHKRGLKFTRVNADSTLEKEYTARRALVYFVSAGIAGGTITVETHERAYRINSLGVKTLASLKKYQVDVLGNLSEVKKETRQRFR